MQDLVNTHLKYVELTHLFPMHPFSTPWKHQETLRYTGRERVYWEQRLITKNIAEKF